MADWDVICALNLHCEWGNWLPSPTDTAVIRENKVLLNHLFFHFLQEIQSHYNLLGSQSHMWLIVDRNAMWYITVLYFWILNMLPEWLHCLFPSLYLSSGRGLSPSRLADFLGSLWVVVFPSDSHGALAIAFHWSLYHPLDSEAGWLSCWTTPMGGDLWGPKVYDLLNKREQAFAERKKWQNKSVWPLLWRRESNNPLSNQSSCDDDNVWCHPIF